MPPSGGLSERLSMLEKNMLGPEDKPFDEELFNMMKVLSSPFSCVYYQIVTNKFSPIIQVCFKNSPKN